MEAAAQSVQKKHAHNHVLFMYDSHEERMQVLAEYFSDGLANNELCFFVTPQSLEEVTRDFLDIGFDIRDVVERGDLRVSEMVKTYLPDGRFLADFMLANVKDFIHEAKQGGYRGLRTAGEMAWLCDHPDFVDDARDYEEMVTELALQNGEFMGLC
jgi:KaiC/GvpD/RAD55 family RecA-like ATPase